MQRFYLLLLLTYIFAGCNTKVTPTQDSSKSDSLITQSLEDSTPDNNIPIDTLQLGDKKLLVYTVNKAVFDQYPSTPEDTSEASLLSRDAALVKRTGDTLIFTLTNGQHKIMPNHVDMDDEDYYGYIYAGNFPDIHRLGVIGTYYESLDYLLVNPANGDTLHTWGAPVIAPDKKHILCPSMDLEAGFVPNGFQLFSVDNNQIKLIGDIEIKKWGPGEVKWINNNTILATYIFLDDDMNPGTKYVKMVLQ
jgi:hypothetical protein